MKKRKLLFLATEDWFVRSHFLPLVERAHAEDFEVVVAARSSSADLGPARVVPMPFDRGGGTLEAFLRETAAVRALLDAERPDIVHAIALKPIAQLLFAPHGHAGRAFALTGRGYLAASATVPTRALSCVLARRLRAAVVESKSLLIVENDADRRWVEAANPLPDNRVVLMPGAGVDPDEYLPLPEPGAGPIIVGVASRLVKSKGIDIAIRAVQRLRELGENIELRIAGAIDHDNPEHVREEQIVRWAELPGVAFLGHVTDIKAFWADVHIACLPSRGGEGLPRSMLEAAACARAIVTTDVPGCADFVGKAAGIVVPPDNPDALSTALLKLTYDGAVRREMGRRARKRVMEAYTTLHAADCAASAWRRMEKS